MWMKGERKLRLDQHDSKYSVDKRKYGMSLDNVNDNKFSINLPTRALPGGHR